MTTTSPAFTTTYDTGGSTTPAPGVYANPDRIRMPADFDGLLEGSVNPAFVMAFLSAALMHEQCGRHLYRSVAARTNNPMLEEKYRQFGDETEDHVLVLTELIATIGGDHGYVSPSARATEKLDHGALEATFMLDGSLDPLTAELAMLDAVVIAETIDRANWDAIDQLAGELPASPTKDAFVAASTKVLAQEDDHLVWAQLKRSQLVHLQATRPPTDDADSPLDTAIAWIKGLFANDPD